MDPVRMRYGRLWIAKNGNANAIDCMNSTTNAIDCKQKHAGRHGRVRVNEVLGDCSASTKPHNAGHQ